MASDANFPTPQTFLSSIPRVRRDASEQPQQMVLCFLIMNTRDTSVATAAFSNHLGKQLRRVCIHDQVLANLGGSVQHGINLILSAGAEIPSVAKRQPFGCVRLKLHIWIRPSRAYVRALFIRTGSRLGTGSNIKVEQGTREDLESRLGLVSRNGVTGLVGADVTQVSVLADETADI